jgi:hypothetical protein
LVCIVSAANAKQHTSQNGTTPFFKVATSRLTTDTSFHLIYEDAKTKLFYSEDICDNAAVLKLKFINLTDDASVLSYKLWNDATAKSVSLFGHQELEGICSSEYKTVLMETIPAGLSISDIKVSVTY